MKKRIMDLTEEEVKELCEEHDDFCYKYGRFRCPLFFKNRGKQLPVRQ